MEHVVPKILPYVRAATPLLVGLALFLVACQAKLAVHSTQAAAPPATTRSQPSSSGAPVALQGLLAPSRTMFQTRSVLKLSIQYSVGESSEISLVDDSTKQSLIDGLNLGSADLNDGTTVQLLDDAPFDVEIKLYPWLPGSKGRFAYGPNQLRLMLDGNGQEFGQSSITLHDFLFFTPTGSLFTDSVQTSGRFQGDVNRFGNISASNGVETLTVGAIAVLNQ